MKHLTILGIWISVVPFAAADTYTWENNVHGCVVSEATYTNTSANAFGKWADSPSTFLVSLTPCEQVVKDPAANFFARKECKDETDKKNAQLLSTPHLRSYPDAWDMAYATEISTQWPIRARGYSSGLIVLASDGTINFAENGSIKGLDGSLAWFSLKAQCTPMPKQ